MAVKLFVLGLPGSGKSTVFRHIENYVKRNYKMPITRISDYEILHGMYISDQEKSDTERQFRSTEKYDGFDIKDFSVLDDSLYKIHEKATSLCESSTKEEFIVIEFARNNYKLAFKHFNEDFFRDAYILFLDVDIPTCKQRVDKRVLNRKSMDDHFVSGHIFSSYYHKDSKHYIISGFREDYKLSEERIKILDNSGSEKDFVSEVDRFVDFIIKHGENQPNGTKPQ